MANTNEIIATGRRKTSIAIVKLVKGKGRIFVNGILEEIVICVILELQMGQQ